jgi:hypothetical protein
LPLAGSCPSILIVSKGQSDELENKISKPG